MNHSTLCLWLMLFLLPGGTSAIAAPVNDTFASRTVVSATGAGGNTIGAGSQNEVDEKMEPAPANQASVWYEWTAPVTAPWQIRAGFSTGSVCAMATYILPAGATAISQLEPAGASLVPADGVVSVNLSVQAGQRVIIRVWTPDTSPSSKRSFGLSWEGLFPNPFNGERAINAPYIDAGETYTQSVSVQLRNYFTEVEDTRLENGHWAPATVAAWARWKVPPGPAQVWRMALMPESDTAGRCEVLRAHPSQPGRYQSLIAPGTALEFTPVPGETLYIRTSTTTAAHALHGETMHFYFHQLCTTDEISTLTPAVLKPGFPMWASLHGATPSAAPLPAEDPLTLNMPDVWIPLGGLEPGSRYHLQHASSANPVRLQLYEYRPATPLRAVGAGFDIAFTVLPDREYFARLTVFVPWVDTVYDYTTYLYIYGVSYPVPANDEPPGAIVLQAPLTQPLTGDLQGATASPEEALVYSGDPPVPAVDPGYRSVWYALDLPASPDRVGVSAWGLDVTLFKRGPGESLTAIPPPLDYIGKLTYQPDGSRVYARVQGPADRFLFLVVPVTQNGDERRAPIPLNTGVTSRYFPNWATREADEDLPETLIFGTTWHVWTAVETGRYHLSTVGSVDYHTATGNPLVIYRAADGTKVTPVASPYLDAYLPGNGDVMVFDAVAGETYLFRTAVLKSGTGPAVLRITPATESSPYTFWRQSYPAWDHELANPLADPDGDGVDNLWELVSGTHPGIGSGSLLTLTPLSSPSPPGMSVSFFTRNSPIMEGPTGCTPFVIKVERSSDLTSWQDSGSFTGSSVRILASDPLRYVRFRVTR